MMEFKLLTLWPSRKHKCYDSDHTGKDDSEWDSAAVTSTFTVTAAGERIASAAASRCSLDSSHRLEELFFFYYCT